MPSSLKESQPRTPELLAVSFAFPPLAYPRSGQVARLLKHLRFNTALVCADEEGARLDPTLEPDAESHLRACIRVPFPPKGLRRHADRVAARLRLPVWGKIPDEFKSWGRPALRALNAFACANDYTPDLVASFGQPMSDHLVGLKLKRLYGVPWVAHFSDPWVDNPFDRRDPLARRVNLSLERRVMERADLLVFTSEETVELVMRKYPSEWKRKARVLPHSFDPALYPPNAEGNGGETIVRYTGEFYGRRTPRPLVETLRSILSDAPRLLEGVRFELIGQVSEGARAESGLESLPEGLVTTGPPVSYGESLALAARADGLLVIDAPAERSVFLPSKLVDYVGAARPVLGLTPPGASANLITRLGGWTANPSDASAMRRATEEFLSHLSAARGGRRAPWGEPSVRARYEARAVADSFESMLDELLS
ncbi:MAG TPA: glycosyltransferase [Pyrinomonadaceae bacterium]|jgi:glycosyltransferase involved in cell wall biosynthesis|nr:glycosyltransferase [Pyrinomonadaceae bacterium]